ncbi:hypothetical protein [Adlercreutzia sp. ZJ304]|uniref:hypothetical protein n=1 Tax=Adlercreutzia sp. ZJ304 TaxID=2709791 RepID=UPI0013E9B20F|nr:hypothetical protein [Adlercreutzia sp. ZJ304]
METISVLLDTNVLIDFENPNDVLSPFCADVLRKARQFVTFYYHPLQIEELKRNKDVDARKKTLSRVGQFNELIDPPLASVAQFDTMGWSNHRVNDYIDNQLLWCIQESVVSFFVTQDKALRSKARSSGLSEKVFSLNEFSEWLDSFFDSPIDSAAIKNCKCHQIDEKDVFFDSLRESYGQEEFDHWWRDKCKAAQRDCWAIVDSYGRLNGLCVYKEECGEVINNEGFIPEGKTLKLCTFKISETALGSKQGEKLLHVAFKYARRNDYHFLYLHVDEAKHSHLVDLITQFGFERMGNHSTSSHDTVYGKYVKPPRVEEKPGKVEYLMRYYPSYLSDLTVNKFITPIQRVFHERLFPDNSDFKNSLLGDDPELYPSESNAIRKAYICRQQCKTIEPGDLLLFYRSSDRKSIDVLGAVVAVYRSSDTDEICNLVKRRTVYSRDEIETMRCRSATGELLVIVFDYLGAIVPPFTLSEMRKSGMAHPQSLQSFDEDLFSIVASRLES